MKIFFFFFLSLFITGVTCYPVETKSVNDGDSVTLHTNLTDLKAVAMTLWRFEGDRIARINGEADGNPVYDDDDERFKDRLKMNPQNGDLTITNITSQHAGEYTLEISSRERSEPKTFSIKVSPGVPKTVPSGVSSEMSSGVSLFLLLFSLLLTKLTSQFV